MVGVVNDMLVAAIPLGRLVDMDGTPPAEVTSTPLLPVARPPTLFAEVTYKSWLAVARSAKVSAPPVTRFPPSVTVLVELFTPVPPMYPFRGRGVLRVMGTAVTAGALTVVDVAFCHVITDPTTFVTIVRSVAPPAPTPAIFIRSLIAIPVADETVQLVEVLGTEPTHVVLVDFCWTTWE
jgi:hypothetical protein